MTSFRRRATLKAKELEVVKFYHFQFSSTTANADIAVQLIISFRRQCIMDIHANNAPTLLAKTSLASTSTVITVHLVQASFGGSGAV